MKVHTIVATLAVALTVAACASQSRAIPTVSPSQPHGLVTSQLGTGADRTHPVEFVAINGVNVPAGGNNQFNLAPGDYTIRVRPLIQVMNETRSVGGPRAGDARELNLTVATGMRYVIAARVPGNRTSEWEPIVRSTDRM